MTKTRLLNLLTGAALVPLVLTATPAFAQDADAAAQPADDEGSIIVTGQRFIDLEARGATKLPLPIDKIPQSVSLIGENLLDGLNISSAGQLAEIVPGLSQQGSLYGLRTEVKSRGFALDNNYGYKIDGYQYGRFFELDDALIDRVEVVRGPSSATYGIAAPGGLINYVLKSAPSDTQGKISLSYGSRNDLRGQASFGGPINESGTLRALMIVSAKSADSFIDHVYSENVAGGAIVEWDATDRLFLKAVAYLTRSNGTADNGIPLYADGRVPDIKRSTFLGSADRNRSRFKGDLLFTEARYKITDQIELGGNFSYQKTFLDFTGYYALGLSNAGVTSIRANQQIFPQDQTSGEVYAMANFSLFGVEGSSIRVSGSYYDSQYEQEIYSGSRNPDPLGPRNVPISIFATDAALQTALKPLQMGFLFTTPYHNKAKAASLQAVLKPLERLSFVGGITVNDPSIQTGPDTFKYGSQWSYRAGFTYEIVDNLNLYGSWSDSFYPQQIFDVNRVPLPPIKGEQWEGGIKAKLFNGGLLTTLAVYDITQTNAGVLIPGTTPEAFRPFGEVRHKGVELEMVGNINRNWNIYGGVSYLDAKISQSNIASEVGKARPFVPKWSASLFMTYTFTDGALEGFRIGAGGRAVDNSPTSTGNTRDLAGHTVFDALASYTSGPWELRVNVNNIFDEKYLTSSYDTLDLGNRFGAPRSALATVSYNF